jgi:hypothetical protein
MPTATLAARKPSPREMLMWGFLAALVVAQLAMLWMVCSQQVQKAELRDAGVRTQRMALADCLHQGTLSACASRLEAAASHGGSTLLARSTGSGNTNSTVPADFVFR